MACIHTKINFKAKSVCLATRENIRYQLHYSDIYKVVFILRWSRSNVGLNMVISIYFFLTEDLLLVTIATDHNDGLRRYMRSVNKYGLDTKVNNLH